MENIMSKRIVVVALLLFLVGICGWAVAQQNQPERAFGKMGLPVSRYTAVAAGQSAILLDTTSGKTWVMTQGVDGDSAWLPAQKLDTNEAAQEWLAKERKRAEGITDVQREMSRRLDALRGGKPPSDPGTGKK